MKRNIFKSGTLLKVMLSTACEWVRQMQTGNRMSRKHRPRKRRPQTTDLENTDLENADLENTDHKTQGGTCSAHDGGLMEFHIANFPPPPRKKWAWNFTPPKNTWHQNSQPQKKWLSTSILIYSTLKTQTSKTQTSTTQTLQTET